MKGAYLMALLRRANSSAPPRPPVAWGGSARAFKRQRFLAVEPERGNTASRTRVRRGRGESRRDDGAMEAPPLHVAQPPAKKRVDVRTSQALFEGEAQPVQPPTAPTIAAPRMRDEINNPFTRMPEERTQDQSERNPAVTRALTVPVNTGRDSAIKPVPVAPPGPSIVHPDEVERWVETPAALEPPSAAIEAPERFIVQLSDDCPALDARTRIEVERSVVAAARSAVKSSRDASKDLREQTVEVRVERVDVKLEAPPPSPAHVAPTPNAASGLSAFFLSRSVSGW